jgi:AcrR family transcriptional regulator
MAAMSTRGPYAKGLAKREAILNVALAHFAETGYDRASVREIARLAGLTQAGLLHHFSTKEDLFLAVLRRRDDRLGDPATAKHSRPLDRLMDAVERNSGEPGLVRLFVSLSAESAESKGAARAFFAERYEWLRGELDRDVHNRQASGELPEDLNSNDVASLLIAVADGLQLQWLLEPDRVQMSRLLTVLWEALARMPANPPSDAAGPSANA